MAKLRNISYIVKEIVINSSTTNYELNGIVGNNLEFYGLDKITGNYKELPKAWYQLIKNNGNYVFKVVDPSIFNYSKIQVALWYDNKSLTYATEFNPDIKVLVDRYNILVNTVSQLWEYTKRQMIVGDSMEMHLILPKLKSEELWICKGDHYEAISLVDVNAELRKLIDRYAAMYKVELEQKANEQKLEINRYVQELGTQQRNELENYKNQKIGELLSKLTELQNQFNSYVLQKQSEMDNYKQILQNKLYTDSKKEIDDYSKIKIRENEAAIQNKAQEILTNLDKPIENIVQLKIDTLFQATSPRYLSTLKSQIDTYLSSELSKIHQGLEAKIDNYIATKDKLITDKVEDIATKEITKAVARAKENVINEIEANKNQKVQEAIRDFTNQANTLTTQKLKLIEDAVNKAITQDLKNIISNNVNQYMQSFNVVSSKENGKIKLTFTLKDFRKEIELPDGELPDGNTILTKINNDVQKTTQSFKDFKDKLEIPLPVDISNCFMLKGVANVDLNTLVKDTDVGYYYVTTATNKPEESEFAILFVYKFISYVMQKYIINHQRIYIRLSGDNGLHWNNWKKISSDNNNNDLRIKFNSNNSATFLSNNEDFWFNPDTISGNVTISNFYFGNGNTSNLANIYCNTLNAKNKLIAQGEIISSGDITAFSDIRLKTNIEKIENALDKVCQLNGYTYDMNNKRSTGVIAQEVEKVLPEVVQDREDGYKTVAYGNMIGLLIEAIKELKEEIKVIKNGI
nr:MAG TPA: Neck appendage like protein [Bacteriophage sp.]